MGKAKRFNSYDQAVQDQRNIVQNYGQGRQGLSGIRSSFRTSPPSPISDFDPNREENIATVVADNLGNHTATQDLNLAGNDIILSSDGDTKFNVGEKTLTWDELACLVYVKHQSRATKGAGTTMHNAVIDSLGSKGLLVQADTEGPEEQHEWANQEAEDWYDTNAEEIETIVDANLGESDIRCTEL